jgi:hypothetical protein
MWHAALNNPSYNAIITERFLFLRGLENPNGVVNSACPGVYTVRDYQNQGKEK